MTAIVLDVRSVRDQIMDDLSKRVAYLTQNGVIPGLGTVIVGDDPGSHAYVRGKHADCAALGISSIARELPSDATFGQVAAVIDELNADQGCTGYIVQLPLPGHLDESAALERIDPDKDADGLHPTSLGRLALGIPAPQACTPKGIVRLLAASHTPLAGADVVIVGRGVTVGRPLSVLLSRPPHNATVTVCHSKTKDLAEHLRRADIVVAGVGSPGFITKDMVRPGAVVIDVGLTRTAHGLVGDVSPDVREVAGAVSPNPGGVGLLTRAMLLANVVELAERQTGQSL
ncbi:Methylenetetrahydrofolate dehydrogenase (NADP(+)) [Segniliparus rotundus DSM 44985]|uniref:Bifunctional protein FolD n=1 Tax=Segniliparus rotundus (strain ATCC BAA-972 / CDC 1076 / CIP 108378 / DSM 44985 / JCM 13578) TaxID=640132 RepID=D6Z8S0_SEGRD|nr:bifunctional methylenetetrahydrofolate dehydrogenase/methenyltetrahydrofolate cyclohydrolase [Segniliparus rotundus]ADG98350.1 Methylenetetrahydrofolate dehydrogenase (NADP(+)) [Segniliparus rotundus DSM 44985]